MLWDTFDQDREILNRQYENPDYNPESGLPFDELKNQALSLADQLSGQPHSIIKAKAFEYILDNAQISINPSDWFGFHFNATEISSRQDIGWGMKRILNSLNSKWSGELFQGPVKEYNSPRASQGRDAGLFVMYPDYDHSTPNWENIIELGFPGLLKGSQSYRHKRENITSEQTAFFDSITITYNAIIRFTKRLSEEARRYISKNPKMKYLVHALSNLSANPPRNTYEALILALLYWKIQENVECIRVRTIGDLGNLYYRFYVNDIQNNTFSNENIKELFKYFMNHFSAMHCPYQQPMYFGSMDENGDVDINELSRMIFDAYDEAQIYDPKIQVCISEKTPDDFIKRVMKAIRGGNSSISLINSENAIKALLKTGVTIEEARTFVMTGCWDYAVKNEAKTIPLRLNLPKVVELTLHNGIDPLTGNELGSFTGTADRYSTFDEFYTAFKEQLKDIIEYMMSVTNIFEQYLHEYNPSPMYTATIVEGLEKGIDAYCMGAKYCTTVLNVSCLATTIDSLMAIKKFVYARNDLTLPEFVNILDCNWNGAELTRQRILSDDDKYGNGSALADELMVDLTGFTSRLINNKPNGRGGFYKQGQISIDFNVKFGAKTGATPDGRKRGEAHSKNLSSSIGMDRNGLTTLMNSICKMDMTNFCHAGMLDFILHPSSVKGDEGLDVMLAIIRTYFKMGGHSIQGNVFDTKLLKEAQAHPEKYQTLQVRVCGWNVYFVNLSRKEQDLFIAQAEHLEKAS